MQINSISRKHKNKKRMTVGRGSKRGKTSGRGTKGQNARAGHKKRPEIRDLIKKLPKLRGRGKSSFKSFQLPVSAVNLDLIEKHFAAGDLVTPTTLVVKGLIEKYKGLYPRVKILATGEIAKKAIFADVDVSLGAKAKIEKAGGSIKVAVAVPMKALKVPQGPQAAKVQPAATAAAPAGKPAKADKSEKAAAKAPAKPKKS